MTHTVCVKYVAEMFCTVEASTEDEIISAIESGNYDVFDETAEDGEEIFIIENDTLRKIN